MSLELARRFFDEFVEAFAAFDGVLVAQRYLSPYLAFGGPDAARVFVSPGEIAAYFRASSTAITRVVAAAAATGT